MLSTLIVSLILLTIPSYRAAAQTATLKGRIFDKETKIGVPGLRVTAVVQENAAKGKMIGTISGKDGLYELREVPSGKYIVETGGLGFKTQSQQVTIQGNDPVTLDFNLALDIKGLDEVIVTGVASRTQKSVAEVAVARVDASSLQEGNVFQDMSQLLIGKVSGVQIQAASGQVGSGVRFNVRSGGGLNGSGQPVIFVDGVRIENAENTGFGSGGQGFSSLADLNPDDIVSVEVLKGPSSAALYGTSGSNGVVLIKTRNGGKKGQLNKFNVEYKGVLGWNEAPRQYTTDYVLSAELANALFRRGPISQHSVSISGNTNFVNYYASIDRRDEQGITAQNSMGRTSLRANVEAMPSEEIVIKLNTNFIQNNLVRPQNDESNYGLLRNTLERRPDLAYATGFSARPGNDIGKQAVESIENSMSTQRFIGSAELNLKPAFVQGLSLRGLAGFDASNNLLREIFPPQFPFLRIPQGERSVGNQRVENFNVDLSATYTFQPIEGLNSTTILGAQLFSRTFRDMETVVQTFETDLLDDIQAGRQFISADQGFRDAREAGVFFQEELSYNNTYFFSFGVRNDYSSSVGANAPSIFYPRASAAVRLDRLGFLPQELNLVKLRAAYGQSGQLPGTFDGAGVLYGSRQTGYGVGAVPNFNGNPNIQPERIQEIEVGAEIELSDAYGIDFSYFWQFADNSIVGFLTAPSTGQVANPIPRNVGRIDGWGLEASVYATPIRTESTSLQFNLIWNYADNIVRDLGGSPTIFGLGNRNIIGAGFRRSSFFPFPVLGPRFLPSGLYDFALGPLTGTERAYGGTPVPIHTGSFSVTFRFLNDFTLYGLADWGLGHVVANISRTIWTNPAFGNNPEFNRLATALNLAGNPDAAAAIRALPVVEGVQRLTPGTPEYQAAAERFARIDHRWDASDIEPGDFLRVREISLSFNANRLLRDVLQASFVKNLTISASVRNAFLFTRYTGLDVEGTRNGAREINRGNDQFTLLQPRTVNFMLSVGF
jgi:TonB-dependent SusC/RagA subfamily outer membrane receptor